MSVSDILPTWITKCLPEIPVPESFSYDWESDTYIVTQEGESHKFENIDSAYAFTRSNDIEFEFKGTLPENYSFLSPEMLVTPSGTLLISHSKKKDLEFLELKFTQWYQMVDSYDKDPEDFMKAYTFVHNHPILWLKSDSNPFHWEANGYSVSSEPYTPEDGESEPYWGVEVFEHISYDSLRLEASELSPEDGYLKAYGYNPEMSACAKNINDAYIEVAKSMRSHYDLDGTPTENW